MEYYERTRERVNNALIGLSQQEAHDFLLWFVYKLKKVNPMIEEISEEEAVKIIEERMKKDFGSLTG